MHNYTSFRPQKQGISSKNKDFSGNVSGVSAGWTAGWRFFPMLRYHVTVINGLLFFVLISRTVSWLGVRVGQIRQNVSRPFSALLIPSAIHAHLCLFAPGGRQWKKPGNIFHVYCVYFFAVFPYAYHWGGFRQMIRCGVSTKGGRGSPAGRQPHLYAGGIQKTAGGDLSAWLTL